MTIDKKLCKTAADLLEGLADGVAKLAEDLQSAESAAAEHAHQVKVAADTRAANASAAKVAAAAFFDAGLVRSEEARDELAVGLLDHGTALEQLSKIASNLDAPAVGRVTRDVGAPATPTADEVWAAGIRSVSY